LLAKGMKPEMARLTLARKIAVITLTLWKKEERFDAEQRADGFHNALTGVVSAMASLRQPSFPPARHPQPFT
jgi:hypothetical protein